MRWHQLGCLVLDQSEQDVLVLILNCFVAEKTLIHHHLALIKFTLPYLARLEESNGGSQRPTLHFSNPSNLLGEGGALMLESRNRAFGDKPNSAPIRRMSSMACEAIRSSGLVI